MLLVASAESHCHLPKQPFKDESPAGKARLSLLTYANRRKQKQWLVLRRLRRTFIERYEQLQSFAIKKEMPGLLEICAGSASKMLEAAILTFHDINSGRPPTALKEVIHFINLSFSMAEVMKTRGHDIQFNPSDEDFEAWRSCLKHKVDSSMFDSLVTGFWRDDGTSSMAQPMARECGKLGAKSWADVHSGGFANSGLDDFSDENSTLAWNSKEAIESLQAHEQGLLHNYTSDPAPTLTNSIMSLLKDASSYEGFDFSVFLDSELRDGYLDPELLNFELPGVPASGLETGQTESPKVDIESNCTTSQSAQPMFPPLGIQDMDTSYPIPDIAPMSSTLTSLIKGTAQFLQALLFLTCKSLSM